jgi:ATP-dependent RNA helicase DHX37/DHR1
MTEYDDADEEKEMVRLRSILKDSEEHLKDDALDDDKAGRSKRDRQSKASKTHGEDQWASKDLCSSILSQEGSGEMAPYAEDYPFVMLPPKKKKTKQAKTVELTPQEIRQAKLLQKNNARKLRQLTDRAEQKKKRTDLYAKLKEYAVSPEVMQLLSSSSTLGKRETTRETLKRLLQRERAGVPLTTEEKNLLYQERGVVEDKDFDDNVEPRTPTPDNTPDQTMDKTTQVNSDDEALPKQKTKRKKQKRKRDEKDSDGAATTKQVLGTTNVNEAINIGDDDNRPPVASVADCETKKILTEEEANTAAAPADFAAQMMASLSSLKVKSTEQKEEQEAKDAEETNKLEAERLREEEKQHMERSRYVPRNPAVLKTAAAIGLDHSILPVKRRTVLEVNRPADIQAARYDLPVSGMEFEIVDAIRNNDVTILCGETGSGKSTQVPQFLYEAGFTLNEKRNNKDLLIGVTQPRRVAAVSTAKRVCYEMGRGDGHAIKKGPAGNLVAYQTRYETAGLGRDTRVKFMTDGILLQEIQSDLLLRKYGAIVLDEAHERNLNTDVLLGLLSVAVPLRRKAASEEGSDIGPLKLVIMSATLRVEDFTENNRLFPNVTPALVKVPGRTHPVTIHHSKITELDDYGQCNFV